MYSSRVLWEEATEKYLDGNIQLMENDEGWKSQKFWNYKENRDALVDFTSFIQWAFKQQMCLSCVSLYSFNEYKAFKVVSWM